MKRLKKIGKWFLIILVLLNLGIIISGKTYLYKGIANTYLKGHSGPGIDEYKIFENRDVANGTYLAWAHSKKYNSRPIPTEAQKEMDVMQSVAYVIVKDDSLIHEEYWDGYGEDSYSNSFSMAKTFTSILIGIAIDEGKIKSVDQPVGDFLPEYKTGENAKLTIKHLLTMSSGIDFDENYVNPFAYPAAAYYGTDLKKLTDKYSVKEEPGKVFKYLSGNSVLLGFIVVLTVFIIPIVDTTTVFINRIKKGKSPFIGGKDHTTHHLFFKGVTEKRIAILFFVIQFIGLCLALNLVLNFQIFWLVLSILFCSLVFLTLFINTIIKQK